MFTKMNGKFMYNVTALTAFMVRDIIALNDIFSIFPLTGLVKLVVYLKVSH